MSNQIEFQKFLAEETLSALEEFTQELNTDENKDYRRGYRAGVLFSLLLIKSNLGMIDNVAAEHSTD